MKSKAYFDIVFPEEFNRPSLRIERISYGTELYQKVNVAATEGWMLIQTSRGRLLSNRLSAATKTVLNFNRLGDRSFYQDLRYLDLLAQLKLISEEELKVLKAKLDEAASAAERESHKQDFLELANKLGLELSAKQIKSLK